jgi:hypothetical protein
MNNIIKDYIYSIDIPIDTSVRLDCPICSGTKTLSVTKFTDCTKYYCFHANCTKGGVIKEGLNITSFNTPTYKTMEILLISYRRTNSIGVGVCIPQSFVITY